MQKRQARNAANILFLGHELHAILDSFEQNQLPALAYKGPALAKLAYGDPTLRQAGDLDILIQRRDLQRARELLETRGYRTVQTLAQEKWAMKRHYHLHFKRDVSEIHVKLHWAFTAAHCPFPLDDDRLWERRFTVDVAGMSIRCLGPDVCLLALCAHAAKEGWPRPGMVCDVAHLVANCRALDWDWIQYEICRIKRERVLLLGLALAASLPGVQLPAAIVRRIAEDRSLIAMAAQVSQNMLLDKAPRGVQNSYSSRLWCRPGDPVGLFLHVVRSMHAKLLELVTPTSLDEKAIRIPEALQFLYYLVRPLRAILTYRSSPGVFLRRLLRRL